MAKTKRNARWERGVLYTGGFTNTAEAYDKWLRYGISTKKDNYLSNDCLSKMNIVALQSYLAF